MSVRKFWIGGLLVLSGCRGHPCVADQVARVESVCKLYVARNPPFLHCYGAGLKPPGTFDFLPFDTETCSQQGAGALVSCMATHANECLTDAGMYEYALAVAVFEKCSSAGSGFRPGANSTSSCSTDCTARFTACVDACPIDGWDACATCVAPCELAHGGCVNKCSEL